MSKAMKIILAIGGLFFFILIALIVHKGSKSSNDENILASEVDTNYTYRDMQTSNESRKDEYSQGGKYNSPLGRSSNTAPESNIGYNAEEARIRQVSQNIETHRPLNDTDEIRETITYIVSKKGTEYTSRPKEELTIKPVIEQKRAKKENLFNDSSSDSASHFETEQQYISAVIHGEQSIREGSQIKLRTTQDFTLNGENIPKNTFIFGAAMISENRLNINISGFKANGNIFRVNMTALDQDGLSGLRLIGGQGEGVTDQAIDVADYSTSSALNNIPVVGSIAQGTRELLRNKRTANAKPIILGSNYKVFLKMI